MCALCAFVIEEMKGVLNSSTVQKSIMDKALEVCSSLPKEMGPSCSDFVTTYGAICALSHLILILFFALIPM